MYTDPKRLRATDPGETDPAKNPLWAFHETFNPDLAWVDEHRELYKAGKVGDVAVKKNLVDVLNVILEPIRTKRKHFEDRPDDVLDALRMGTVRGERGGRGDVGRGQACRAAGLLPADADDRVREAVLERRLTRSHEETEGRANVGRAWQVIARVRSGCVERSV